MSFHKSCFGQKSTAQARLLEEFVNEKMYDLMGMIQKKFNLDEDDILRFLHGYFKRNPFGLVGTYKYGK